MSRGENNSPSSAPQVSDLENLYRQEEVAQLQNKEIERIAEQLFEITTSASDDEIVTGKIPLDKNNSENNLYIKILNRLLVHARKPGGGIAIMSREYIEATDKKSAALIKCIEGGLMADIFGDVVAEEIKQRTPKNSPQKFSAQQVFAKMLDKLNDQNQR